MSNSSGDGDDQDLEPWCADAVNFLSPIHLDVTGAEKSVDEPTAEHQSRENF